jgi:hypothetical protein
MKTIRTLVTLSFLLLIGIPGQAQIFKKLKEKVSRAVEEEVTNKVADKAAREAGDAMDLILTPDFGENSPVPMGISKGDMDEVPETYSFDWAYRLKMEMPKSKDDMEIEYRLKEDGAYWGAQFDHKDMQKGMKMFMVYDHDINQTVMFMESDDMKMATATKLDTSEIIEETGDQDGLDTYTMTRIEGKTILGYDCDGFVMENDDNVITMYMTFDVDVSFGDIYDQNQKLPENFDPDWLKNGDKQGLVMEMDFKDKKDKKNQMKMTCIRLEEEPFSISKSAYQTY